jgi:hypothetical protein
MGASVSSQFEWSDPIASKKDGQTQLQTSVTNQELLYNLNTMIEQVCINFPAEAKAEFRMPLVWTSKIAPNAFTNSSIWTVKDASK